MNNNNNNNNNGNNNNTAASTTAAASVAAVTSANTSTVAANAPSTNGYPVYQAIKKQRLEDGSAKDTETAADAPKANSGGAVALGPYPSMTLTLQKDASWSTMLNDVEGFSGLGPMPSMNAVLEKRQSSMFSISSLLPSGMALHSANGEENQTVAQAMNASDAGSMANGVAPPFADGSGGNQKYMDTTTGEYMYPENVKPMTFPEKQRLVQKITLLPSQYLRGLMDVISKYQPDTVRQIDDDGYAFDLGQMNENTVWAISDYVKESMVELDGYIKSITSANIGSADGNTAAAAALEAAATTNGTAMAALAKNPQLRHQVHEVALSNPKMSAICSNENQGKFMEQVEMYSKPKVTKSRVKPSKKHECPTCNKQFRGRSELQNHVRTHTGEKPLKCSYAGCNKRYAHSSNLRAHERTHAGVKPYACHYDGCGKSFAHSVSLKEHIWMHAGFQPYVCPYEGCEKRFTQVSNFARHKKTHEKEERGDAGSTRSSPTAAGATSVI
ncbi:TPA: hypothetical protein N0F65_013018 [Lagenidium giganteum]|uniref:C2H2-type domain-containing protein n=1 Tax=Lagenidium giganteum TaxID=4803 RepID=A0AAV2YQI5_9STRA|nr:TPA: hypothetical protein N0F65_013018 [Lagenidium giganteum]